MLNKIKQFKLLDAITGAEQQTEFKYPGVRDAIDGNTAVILVNAKPRMAPVPTRSRRRRRWANTGRKQSPPGI